MVIILGSGGKAVYLWFLVACFSLFIDFIPKFIYIVGSMVIICIVVRGSTSFLVACFVLVIVGFIPIVTITCWAADLGPIYIYLIFVLVFVTVFI